MAIQVISFKCVLKNNLGQLISSTMNRDVLTHSPAGSETLRGLADALQDLEKGEKRVVRLRAEQAYGFYNPDLVIIRRFDDLILDSPLKLGERVSYLSNGQMRSFRVVEVTQDAVTLDGNHPLAGQDLIFEIETTEARPASAAEIADALSPSESELIH